MQDVVLDRGADPPYRIGREAEAAIGIEPLDRLHHADIAFADQFADRQAISLVSHGDLGDETQMRGHQLMGGLHVLIVAPGARQCQLVVRPEHREFADLQQIAGEIAIWSAANHRRNHEPSPLFGLRHKIAFLVMPPRVSGSIH